MTIFDQRGQNVSYQYNAAGDINFDRVRSQEEFVRELERLKTEVSNATISHVIDAEIASHAEHHLTKAIYQSKKEEPDKKAVINHINNAKTLIESFAAASGLVTGLLTAAELAQKFFH